MQVTKQGKDYVVCCPFHEEKTPSCIISPKTNLFNCFGCGTGGSVIDWVMKTQGVSFRFACEILQKDLGLIVDSGTATTKQNTTTKLTPPLAANADSQTALRQVSIITMRPSSNPRRCWNTYALAACNIPN